MASVTLGDRSSKSQEPCCDLAEARQIFKSKEVKKAADQLAALGDPVRLALFKVIEKAGKACACEFVEATGKSQPTVSHHLKILFDAGLITKEKQGTWIYYGIAKDGLKAVSSLIGSVS